MPSTFYFNAESVGSIPVRSAVEQGLDILIESLASVILAVEKETGMDEEEAEDGDGMADPTSNGVADGYGQGGYGGGGTPGWAGGGNAMSPYRR